MTATTRRALEILALAAVPLVALLIGLATFADQDRLALDFHAEIYPQAEAIVHGRDPYPDPAAAITVTANAIWPIAAVLPAVPLTAVPAAAADWIATFFVLACLVGALLTLGVRDWRIYGVTLLWPSVIDAYQTANVTLPLMLLVAIMWRYRDRRAMAGVALGVALALKFFLWPVVLWLVATGRRGAAAISAAIAVASLALLVPWIGILDYVRLLRKLGATFDGLSYTPYALLLDLGAPSAIARAVTLLLGGAVIAVAWRRRSLGLAVAAALCLSPIVWRHFFAFLAVPLAISRPRFDRAWLLPLGLWVAPGTLNGDTWQTASVLALAAATVAVCEWRRPAARTAIASNMAPADA
jgi:hypothetical protein